MVSKHIILQKSIICEPVCSTNHLSEMYKLLSLQNASLTEMWAYMLYLLAKLYFEKFSQLMIHLFFLSLSGRLIHTEYQSHLDSGGLFSAHL